MSFYDINYKKYYGKRKTHDLLVVGTASPLFDGSFSGKKHLATFLLQSSGLLIILLAGCYGLWQSEHHMLGPMILRAQLGSKLSSSLVMARCDKVRPIEPNEAPLSGPKWTGSQSP